mgnify:CR=1 FL=1
MQSKTSNPMLNVDYIDVIKKTESFLTCDKIKTDVNHLAVDKLHNLLEDEAKSLLDMQECFKLEFYDNSHCEYNYCYPHNYRDIYIANASYPNMLSDADYDKQLLEKKENVLAELQKDVLDKRMDEKTATLFIEKELDKEMCAFLHRLKYVFYSEAERYIYASSYWNLVDEITKQNDIIMYSTESIGWTNYKYIINDDIMVFINSNFAYGKSSYFIVGLRYKGIDLIPYSFHIRYFFASEMDILRGMKSFEPKRERWEDAFLFIVEAANLAIKDQNSFVNKYIVDEVNNMITGLEEIMSRPQIVLKRMINAPIYNANHYISVKNITWGDKQRFGVCPKEMAFVFKAEKITGALTYIESLQHFLDIDLDFETSINKIKDWNKTILPDIKETKLNVSKEIDSLINKSKIMEDELATLEKEYERYQGIIKDIENKYEGSVLENELKRITGKSSYISLLQSLEIKKKNISDINHIIKERKNFIHRLDSCIERIGYVIID